MKKLTVLIPTCNRITALAVTLTSLCFQTFRDFDVIISDQSENESPMLDKSVQTVSRLLTTEGHQVTFYKNLPNRGLAQQRQFLLEKSHTQYSLFLDDDVILNSFVVKGMMRAIQEEKCGFVGEAVIGLSFIGDVRRHEQHIEFWDRPVTPEKITPGGKKWKRYTLHNAANIWHVQNNLHLSPKTQKKYKVAWIGGCVLYDTQKLLSINGFSFWKNVPQKHCGEDVLVQLAMLEHFGGCGIIPSGAYHQELPTTIPDRSYNLPTEGLMK